MGTLPRGLFSLPPDAGETGRRPKGGGVNEGNDVNS